MLSNLLEPSRAVAVRVPRACACACTCGRAVAVVTVRRDRPAAHRQAGVWALISNRNTGAKASQAGGGADKTIARTSAAK